MEPNLTQKLIESHLVEGEMAPGEEIGLRIDQTLTQDATGTLVMLEFEALNLPRVQTEISVQYIDHNLLQEDFRNPDDHEFLRTAAKRYGVWFSPAGNGVSHPVHQERFGAPGKTLVGSDSHTPAAGAIGMLAIGAGGLEVAMAMAGKPLYLTMPKVFGVELTGDLPDWVSAKDVILEMLRRHGVKGARGFVLEYFGDGLKNLTAMDRHVIANMGTELGATSSVFPSDGQAEAFLLQQGRGKDWRKVLPGGDCGYERTDHIDLSKLEPLIAKPSSPGNVVPVSEVAGAPLYQAYIGSSANPGLRDFAVPAMMVRGRRTDPAVSFDVNPTSRQMLETLTGEGYLADFIRCGARIHQAGCNGCIGMGQAPATNGNSLRTVPRNFPGRSGTREDRVFLCSPETATASALTGKITDPRELPMDYPKFQEPETVEANTEALVPPAPEGESIEIIKGPNIVSLPELESLPAPFHGAVLLKIGDDISTDEILPAGARVLPYRSNLPAISRFAFEGVEEGFADRVDEHGEDFIVVGGHNYGQGSSREHAALAPRYLGLRVVIAKSFARIHQQNLANFGVLPLTFDNDDEYDRVDRGEKLELEDWAEALKNSGPIRVRNTTKDWEFECRAELSERQRKMILAGSLIALNREA